MNKIGLMVACCSVVGHLFGADEPLISNIYERVNRVYGSDKWDSPRDVFRSVRGGDGYEFGSVRKPFYELIPVVSNNFEKIVRDWDAYATNEVVAFTVANAAAYSGGDVLVTLANEALSRYERTNAADDWWLLKYLLIPDLTPQMHFMIMHYDSPAVNDLIVRFRACAETRGVESNRVSWCDEALSGSAKKEYLELKAAGAIE